VAWIEDKKVRRGLRGPERLGRVWWHGQKSPRITCVIVPRIVSDKIRTLALLCRQPNTARGTAKSLTTGDPAPTTGCAYSRRPRTGSSHRIER
jgi:hypothetical protein